MIAALAEVGEPNGGDGPYEAEVRRAVGRVVADGLMRLADGAPMSQVRAVAARHLGQLGSMAASLALDDGAQGAHFALLARDIQRFEDRPYAPWTPVATPNAPPGAPIGTPAMDWVGDWVRDWTRWSPAGGPWIMPTGLVRGLPTRSGR